MQEGRTVWALLVAGEEMRNRHAAFLELVPGRERDHPPCLTCSHQVLGERGVIEQSRRSACSLVAHRLPLAVGGLHRTVLGFKISQRPWFGAEALADRLE